MAADDSSAPRAVVCDSDAISARRMGRTLSGVGFRVDTCGTAAECEAAVRAEPAALVVTAILLPDLDGLALARRLRAWRDENGQGPRIVVSSILQAEQRALEAGADAFLPKPVSRTDLERLISGPVPQA